MGTRPNLPPSEDEISFRLQENKGLLYIIQSILEGDTKAREYWFKEWGIDSKDMDWRETAESYKQAYNDLKSILGLAENVDTQEVAGKVRGLLELIKELQEEQKPRIIYKYEGKDYEFGIRFWNLIIAIEKGGGNSGK